jgi:hypothetical protein
MRSDAKAMKLLLALLDRYAETTEAKVQLGELLAEDQKILAEYLRAPKKPVPGPAGNGTEPLPEPAKKADEGGDDDDD